MVTVVRCTFDDDELDSPQRALVGRVRCRYKYHRTLQKTVPSLGKTKCSLSNYCDFRRYILITSTILIDCYKHSMLEYFLD